MIDKDINIVREEGFLTRVIYSMESSVYVLRKFNDSRLKYVLFLYLLPSITDLVIQVEFDQKIDMMLLFLTHVHSGYSCVIFASIFVIDFDIIISINLCMHYVTINIFLSFR